MNINETFTPLSKLPKQPIRLGLQSAPGEGKTWSALTFPDVIVLNLDNKLGGYQAEHPDSGLKVVNFDKHLVLDILDCSNNPGKKNIDELPLNVVNAVSKWIRTFGISLTPSQTLLIDSWSSLQNRFDSQMQLNHMKVLTKNGEEDRFAFWKLKLKYSTELTDDLKALSCNSVVTLHETIDRDDDGKPTGKLRPLMQGGFSDQMAGQFTDWYRQICVTKDHKFLEDIQKGFGGPLPFDNTGRCWLWQTQSSAIFTACCSIPGLNKFILADYKSLIK